jgi:hypothetical protein
VSTWEQFFGFAPIYNPENSVDDALHMQLDLHGKIIQCVTDSDVVSFEAIVRKEKRVFIQKEHGTEEEIHREVIFPANDTTGQTSVRLHQEFRIGGVKYQLKSSEAKSTFWVCTLQRINSKEISRENRRQRGKM